MSKEEGIGSGTRRILAVTGKEAFEAYREQEDALKAVAATLKALQLKKVPHKVEGLQEQLRQLQKENAELKEKAAAAAAGDVFKNVQEANGHRYIASQVSVSDAGAFVPLRITGNKKITLMCLFLSQPSVTRSMSL